MRDNCARDAPEEVGNAEFEARILYGVQGQEPVRFSTQFEAIILYGVQGQEPVRLSGM